MTTIIVPSLNLEYVKRWFIKDGFIDDNDDYYSMENLINRENCYYCKGCDKCQFNGWYRGLNHVFKKHINELCRTYIISICLPISSIKSYVISVQFNKKSKEDHRTVRDLMLELTPNEHYGRYLTTKIWNDY